MLSTLPALLGGGGVLISSLTLHFAAAKTDIKASSPNPAVAVQALRLSVAVVVLQHLSGHSASLFFLQGILKNNGGFNEASSAADVAFFLSLVKLACCGVAYALLDTLGRRRMVLMGGSGASCSLLMALWGFSAASPGLSITALALNTVSFQASFGPLG